MTGHPAAGSRSPARAQTRRSSKTVRADLLHAARAVFGERGFSGARTREIAERAKATEQMMYRHFRTKEELFEQAVFEPFTHVVDEFIVEFTERSVRGLSDEQLARTYVTGLFGFLRENRRDVLTLLTMRAHHPELFSTGPLDKLFPVLERAVDIGRRDHGQEAANARLTVRVTFGMVLSAAVLDETLLGMDADQEGDQLVDELTAYVMAGVIRRAP
ncbi:helix-turn-helix domain-containing protein [Streptomyces sp. NPDC005803]|uniref:TetR/AcrR family transcriptional regulator n=1 Tax=Streptomyces sp. NPDC005803 TaxID=3154297 RepID=UPI0033CF9A1A